MRLPVRLRARLVLSHLFVTLAALGTVALAVSLVGPGYFAQAMGHRPGDPHLVAMDAVTLAAFQEAVLTALTAAFLIALIATLAIALALAARIALPVSRLVDATRRIAAGYYAERVPSADGEIGELANTFNAMAGSLEATERRRIELVGDVAHELRTPLTTLDGYLEGLQDGVVRPDPETWALLRLETGRLSQLVSDLSELWHAEAHRLPLNLETLDAIDVAADVVARFRPQAEAHSLAVTASVPTGLRVRADRVRVGQILSNYLSNAVRYSADGSAIEVTARRDGGEIVLAVRDEGPGLRAEELALVFERFYRIDPSRSRALGGAGIGLAIVRALAEAMGGRAWAESGGAGSGSTFAVALPAAP